MELNFWCRKACEPELHIKVTGVSHQLIQVDVLFGDTLVNSKHLVLAVNLWSGFTRPLFAVASGSSDAWIEIWLFGVTG